MSRKVSYDLIIYGATGFAGSIAAKYILKKDRVANLRVAIGGRNKDKLQSVANQCEVKPDLIVVDAHDIPAVNMMVQQTSVILNFAGPFALYAELIIAACAKLGVDYVDITGESVFVRKMIVRYQDDAEKSGAHIIPFCGFDSIPADLSVFLALEEASKKGWVLDQFTFNYKLRGGGVNGGSLATAINSASSPDKARLLDANCLMPDLGSKKLRLPVMRPAFDAVIKRWTIPFFMNFINTSVVNRSAWLRAQRMKKPEKYQPVNYEERLVISNRFGFLKAVVSTMLLIFYKVASNSRVGRSLLSKIGPRPGEGPSESEQENGFTQGELICYSVGVPKLKVTIKGKGDPGNGFTVKLAWEASRLAIEKSYVNLSAGFVTPTAAFGNLLVERLAQNTDTDVSIAEIDA